VCVCTCARARWRLSGPARLSCYLLASAPAKQSALTARDTSRCSLEDHRPGETPQLPAEAAGAYFDAAVAGPNSEQTAEALRLARSCATDGTAEGTFEALRLVTEVLRAQGGETAVFAALRAARENHQRVQMSAERPGPGWVLAVPSGTAQELKTGDALLAASGRERVILDAAADGSSTMCPACGALVGRERWQAHVQNWCSAMHAVEDEDMDTEEKSAIPLHLLRPPC
jgi:hypothetical protein